MSDGWCPFASRYPTTKFWKGSQGRKAAVMHIAQGSYEAAVSWLQNATSNPNSSAHFVIAKDGRIAQLVSIWDSAWANGLRYIDGKWYTPGDPPRLENPSWADMVDAVNPNLYTISVEHEGYYTEQWTAEMYAANTRLLKWIAQELSQPGAPFQWVAHHTLIGHMEIDPVDRANCPGPNVDYLKIARDSNVSDLFDSIVPQAQLVHVYGTTALVTLPTYAIVTQITETDVPAAGYLDYNGTRWFISQYSYQNRLSNFFDSAATKPPVQDMVPGIALNPGYRDTVTPSPADLQNLGASWLRVLLSAQYQNAGTGQNSELDWLLDRCSPLGIKVLALVNVETVGTPVPPHGPGWGDANSGYIGTASTLISRIAAYYKDRLGAIEVWNEPDVQGIQAGDYAALLKATFTKVKSVSSLPVVSAGICCGESFPYLLEFAQAARGAFDFAGWHVYAERVDGFPGPSFGSGELRNSLSTARALGGKPLWITEVGAQLDWSWGSGASASDSVAAYLTRAMDLMRNLGRNVVGQAFWFTWYSPGESWGLVDATYNKRPAWFAFQKEGKPPPAPPAQAAINNVGLSPTSLEAGKLLNVSITVNNNSSQILTTQGPNPGFVYNEGETFETRGFASVAGSFRVGLDFQNRTGIDHPYRWGLGSPLAPGNSATITGAIRLVNPGKKNYWAGLVQELTAWIQDGQGQQAITVNPSGVPIGTTPVITSVSFSPATLSSGDVLNVTIVVRNDGKDPLPTMGPNPGFAYQEGDTFATRGFVESQGVYRVGVDFDGRSGVDHPYRWGLGSPLPAGQARVIMGSIQLKQHGTKNYWAGLVRERVAWLSDKIGTQAISVSPTAPPPAGQPTITDVSLTPTKKDNGLLLQVSVTVENDSNVTLPTQGPDPGTTYNEDENYLTKGYPPGAGAFRIGADFDGRTGIDHPYRWGLGQPLAPGQSVIVTGYVLLKRQQNTNFWVALIQEGTGAVVDALGRTFVTV